MRGCCPRSEKPGDKVSKIGVGIYKQDREALTYLPGAVYELYTVDDIYSADGTKLLDAGTKLATSSTTNASGFTWFDVDVPIRSESYPDSGNSGRYRIVEITAPAGYLLDSTPVDVEFTYEGQQIAWQVVNGTNTNLRTSVDISKQDITNGKELPGAKLEIRDADGNLVEGWTSGKNAAHRARSGTGKRIHPDGKARPGWLHRSRKHRVQAGAGTVQSRSMRCM